MKVGIMSMQRVINYGSFLQAYGLKSVIQALGHRVEFVDYEIGAPLVKTVPEKPVQRIYKKAVGAFKLLSPGYRRYRAEQIQMNQSFGDYRHQFQNHYFPELGVTERNTRPQLDALVIGSDEVFNCTQAGEDVGYSLQLFGDGHRAGKLISYAASFGSTTMDKLKRYGKDGEIGECLNRFDAISVRDENSAGIVKELCGKVPQQHIDPVLLYDFPEVDQIKISRKDYIIVYAYAGRINSEEFKMIKAFAREKGKKLISLGFYQPGCDEYIQAHPFEVLAYVKNADYVITDTFHGTVFSIKYQVPFATIIRDSNQQKLSDLLQRFDLQSRRVIDRNTMGKILDTPVDKESVREKLRQYQGEANRYLKENL